MDMSQLMLLLDSFHAAYKRVYRYVNGTWWAWNADEVQWEYLGVKLRMGRAFTYQARDLFPDNLKIQHQVTRDYIQDRLVKGMVPYLRADTLPGDPFSQ